jgi:hypothetical protein
MTTATRRPIDERMCSLSVQAQRHDPIGSADRYPRSCSWN